MPSLKLLLTRATEPVVMLTLYKLVTWMRYPLGSQFKVGRGVWTNTVPGAVPEGGMVVVAVVEPVYPVVIVTYVGGRGLVDEELLDEELLEVLEVLELLELLTRDELERDELDVVVILVETVLVLEIVKLDDVCRVVEDETRLVLS